MFPSAATVAALVSPRDAPELLSTNQGLFEDGPLPRYVLLYGVETLF